jgi:transcriptional regulator GlxA family with amidase domain
LWSQGGMGTRKEMHNTTLIDWIRSRSREADLLLSVCTRALLLAKAGLLEGLAATTHHGAMELLRQVAPNTTIREEKRIVDNGKIVLFPGISAGIDMSLYVVSKLWGGTSFEDRSLYGIRLESRIMTFTVPGTPRNR